MQLVLSHSPGLGDDSEAVSSLSIPHTDLSHQAAADEQHPITSQTFNVLRREKEHSSACSTSRASGPSQSLCVVKKPCRGSISRPNHVAGLAAHGCSKKNTLWSKSQLCTTDCYKQSGLCLPSPDKVQPRKTAGSVMSAATQPNVSTAWTGDAGMIKTKATHRALQDRVTQQCLHRTQSRWVPQSFVLSHSGRKSPPLKEHE